MQIREIAFLLLICALTAITRPAAAGPQLNPACPENFFTNVASRLLSSQMNMNLDHIQIYPTNQYTPAVHRLLQVTANILDATTTNYYPSIFRPLFWKTNEECGGAWQTNIYIAGYQYLQEPLASNNPPILNTPTDASDAQIPFGLSGMTNNIYGIPWVIGVKKGLPNFNALELDTCFFIERLLQFNRNTSTPGSGAFPYGRVYTTNQMYVMGISNLIGIDDWNSYAESYSNDVTIVAQDALSVTLTNDVGVSIGHFFSTNAFATTNSWPGYSFLSPFGSNITVIQNLGFSPSPASPNGTYIYYYTPKPVILGFPGSTFVGPCFIPESLDPSNFLDQGTPPLPHFGLSVTNKLQAYIIDANNCILDYVQLAPANSSLDINSAIADPDSGTVGSEISGLWSTNIYANSETPWGVIEQFLVSSGASFPAVEDSDEGSKSAQIGWTTAPIPGLGTRNSVPAQQAYFNAFFSASDVGFDPADNVYVTNISLSALAPFTPIRYILQRTVYAANDPLVHYMSSDLNDFADDTSKKLSITTARTNGIMTIGILTDRYMPWGAVGNLSRTTLNNIPADNNAYNFSYKDPLVMNSDNWDFPTNETLNATWLGQVHRGTPWQTIYLKSPNILAETAVAGNQTINIGMVTWELWTGDTNLADAVSMAPVQDWGMAALLASLFNTNNEASLFSVNDSNPGDWENMLNGMIVQTNDLPDPVVQYDGPGFAALTISSNSTQAAEIANSIESAGTALPGQLFTTPGEIFAVPQLSVQSPFLNWNDPAQEQDGISDAAYEAIPDQLLPLLRIDSIGSMTTANGQVVIQFTGDDNHVYAIQSSPDLANWTTISTNCPMNGVFTFTNNATANVQFYRTILLY